MSFKNIFAVLILAHSKKIFLAAFLFLWVVLTHRILGVTMQPITLLLFGTIIATYQQYSLYAEDVNDGFHDHCIYSGTPSIFYIFAKFACELTITLLPMFIIACFEISFSHSTLILLQWAVLHVSFTSILMINLLNPLRILVGMLPALITSLILFMNFLNLGNENTLLILLGYDIILCSIACFVHTSNKRSCNFNVSFSS